MAKQKTEVVETSKKEKVVELLKARVSKLFDREPNGSIQESEVSKLAEDLLNL